MELKGGLTERQRYWLGQLEACERSGRTTKAYAQEHGLSVSMLYSWRKKLAARGLWCRGSGRDRGVSFDRVDVIDAGSSDQWRMVLPNGVEIGFSGVVDEAALSAVLGAASRL